ncbi:MAG: septal ring lytic transglycosylase RlpA family protein [Pseudomonadales bacterium]
MGISLVRIRQLAQLGGCLLLLSGCNAPEPVQNDGSDGALGRSTQVDGPPRVPHADLTTLPDQVPKVEPLSKYGNPDSYTVRGKTYWLLPSADGYDRVGNASWYGQKFHGLRTSSGEPFNMYQLTAAHRELPIPAYVEVTNLENNKRTVVRVNDRGPFHSNRIIDLSYAAAVKLGFQNDGTAKVRVRVIEPAQAVADIVEPQPKLQGLQAAVEAPVATTTVDPDQFYLQAGAFSQAPIAEALRTRLEPLSAQPIFVVQVPADQLFRVRIGPFTSRAAAQNQQQTLAAAEHPGTLILSAAKVTSEGACLAQC